MAKSSSGYTQSPSGLFFDLNQRVGFGATQGLSFDATSFNRLRVKFHCPAVLQILSENKNTYYLNINDEYVNNCAMPCENNIFEKTEIAFARSWVLIWSALCFLSTLFTILTFLIETGRFRYPERPIIFLSGCYMIVALAYLIGTNNKLFITRFLAIIYSEGKD